jgi:hypothetical protein
MNNHDAVNHPKHYVSQRELQKRGVKVEVAK